MPGLAYDRLQVHSIVSTRIAIATHPSNPVHKTTLNQIRKVLLGQISNWSELGGKDQPIRVVLVGGGGGVTTVIESELLNGKLPEDGADVPNIGKISYKKGKVIMPGITFTKNNVDQFNF